MATNEKKENLKIERSIRRGRTSRDDSIFKNRFSEVIIERKRKWSRGGTGRRVACIFVCLFVLMRGCAGYQEQRFAMEPQDQSAIIGSRVTLPCRVEYKVGTLQWTKDDFGLGTHRNLSGYERYKMIGSDEEGDYSLDIQNVTLEDDASYQCQVSSGLNGEPPIRSRYAQLTVLVAPEPPRIVQGAFIDATEGQDVLIECVSAKGKPAAEITWVDSNQAVIKNNIENKIELADDGLTYTSRSVLRLSPSKEHHNRTITCQAQNTADRAFRMATVQIEVKYAPKIKLFLKSNSINGRLPEGSEARFGCQTESNPPAHTYRWFLNDSPVIGDYTNEMIIFNVSRKHNSATVKCQVSNAVGTAEEKLQLEVTFPPTFRSRPSNVAAEENSTVTLNCDVEGHPTPEIRWLFNEPGRIGVKGKSPELQLKVTNETAGRYTCKATVEGYPEVQSEASVFIKGAPVILSNKTQMGMEGDSVKIECEALSVPRPDDIRWYFEDREVSPIHDPDYATLEDLYDGRGTVKSTLVIRASKFYHFGRYNCSITNEYGNANIAIVLKPLKSFPLFVIIIGVSAAIVIIACLITLMVLCHRKKRMNNKHMSEKPDVTVTDYYKDSDRSSNISDLKPHLPMDGNYDLDYTSSEASVTKMSGGLPLAGPVPLRLKRDDNLLQFRYSNDYSDPAYHDHYFKNSPYIYNCQPGYPPPPSLRVQSPNIDSSVNRSNQGSLTRSVDTSSTVPLSNENTSENNSLKRSNKPEADAINSLGLPVGGETPPTPIYAQPNSKTLSSGIDVRYAATYGNPYLRNSSIGLGNHIHHTKPSATPAPPPYSSVSVRNSLVVTSSGNATQPSHATHV